MMHWILIGAATAAFGVACFFEMVAGGDGTMHADPLVDRGRYLVTIGGCNDCHTPGYAAKAGDVPEDRWLTGDTLGFSGPWGTTYPVNLRRLLGTMSEEEWVRFARHAQSRPPMPWFNLRAMTERDLRAIHRYVRSLPPDDRRVPAFVPPGTEPATAHIVMTPRQPRRR